VRVICHQQGGDLRRAAWLKTLPLISGKAREFLCFSWRIWPGVSAAAVRGRNAAPGPSLAIARSSRFFPRAAEMDAILKKMVDTGQVTAIIRECLEAPE
jgi:hypothetical protein